MAARTHVPDDLAEAVARALREDLGDGDKTAAVLRAECTASARIISGDSGMLCGQPWFDEVFRQLDPAVSVHWSLPEGGHMRAGQRVCLLEGPARALLSGERTALNFLQTLSAVATTCQRYADRIKGTRARILDTRETLPGLRSAQKYAVRIGGCENHRHGLFDAILIQANHIAAAGSIAAAADLARCLYPKAPIEIEVQNLDQMEQALHARAERVLLSGFPSHLLARAAHMAARHRRFNLGDVRLEASGDIDLSNVRDVADAGVDFISVARLTKDIQAIPMTMRFDKGTGPASAEADWER